jgi:hypothetical protein
VLAPELSGMSLICRAVEEYPLGPDQRQDPPLTGCGPRLTVEPEATVTLDSCAHAPAFTCIYGVMAVGVQLELDIKIAVAE